MTDTHLRPGTRIRITRRGGGAQPSIWEATVLENHLPHGYLVRDENGRRGFLAATAKFNECGHQVLEVLNERKI